MFKGSNVALVTPFKNNKLDEETYIKLIHFHIKNGTNGLVPAGTTGESPTLSHNEHEKVIELCVKESKGKLPVFAGTGSNSTEEAISLTTHAEKIGANGALIVTPYYNKPTQEGLYQHYKSINDRCGIPIIIYNIPGRSVIDMSVDTMARLFELKNIIGVKDATGDLNRVNETLEKLGKDFIQLTGNDDNALEFNRRGGVGAISVTANIAPKLCSEFQKYSVKDDDNSRKESEKLDKILQPIHHAMFVESNPSPVKYAAKLLKLCDDDVRLPLVKVTDKTKAIIVVSLYGLPVDIDPIMELARKHNLVVIDDSAETVLSDYKGKISGTCADIGVYSFEKTKHLTSGSEGGMVVTNSEIYAERIRKFAGIGYKNLTATAGRTSLASSVFQDPNYERFDSIGYNYRMNVITAACGLAQFEIIDELIDRRKKIGSMFLEAIDDCSWLTPQKFPDYCEHSYYTFSVLYNGEKERNLTWKGFYNSYIEMGGDGFYACWKNPYQEPSLKEKFFTSSCPVADDYQKKLMCFKTNYRDLELAQKKVNILSDLINNIGRN